MDDILVIESFIRDMVEEERPFNILEISDGNSNYGRLLKGCQERLGITDGVIDRITTRNAPPIYDGAVYRKILDEDYIYIPSLIGNYDFILVLGLFEYMEPQEARTLLEVLNQKITSQVLIITPVDSRAGYRKYHPLVFMGLDFSYSLIAGTRIAMQSFSVFPKIYYSEMEIDNIPLAKAELEQNSEMEIDNIPLAKAELEQNNEMEIDNIPLAKAEPEHNYEKLNIAFALPHTLITGGLKALLQQIRHLTRRGHNVSVYLRSDIAKSAIPTWSDLTEEDYATETVLPRSERMFDHVKGVDIIIIGGIDQAFEFLSANIPVVLWEQGCEVMFGDYRRALKSTCLERLYLHGSYRLPVHILSVSDVLSVALKGVYNRDTFVYPNGIDTAFYHPGEKNNKTPIILLTGHPALAFKGFCFAFDALSRAYADGLRFKVQWAAQVDVIHGEINFPLEVFVRPSQHELAQMYRSADIFLSTSLYESYSLPPLEAMASATAVVATDCGGIRAYAKNGENCILCRQGDLQSVTNALAELISNPDERHRLAEAGRETALLHSADVVIKKLEQRLLSIVRHERSARSGTY